MILKKASEAAVEENQTELAAELDRQRSAVLSQVEQGKRWTSNDLGDERLKK